MADEHETAQPQDQPGTSLDIAANVLVRMEGYGVEHAKRLLSRCTHDEVQAVAACDCPADVPRVVGDAFRALWGEIQDRVAERTVAQN
jgi:hypothetical protein